MNNIDFSQIVTDEQMRKQQQDIRAREVKAACGGRITAVLDPLTMANLQGALLAGDLDETQARLMREGHRWVGQMRDCCRTLIADPSAGFDQDKDWPAAPDGLAGLAALY